MTSFMILLQFQTIFLPYKLCFTMKRPYLIRDGGTRFQQIRKWRRHRQRATLLLATPDFYFLSPVSIGCNLENPLVLAVFSAVPSLLPHTFHPFFFYQERSIKKQQFHLDGVFISDNFYLFSYICNFAVYFCVLHYTNLRIHFI